MNLLQLPKTVQSLQRLRQIVAILAEYGFSELLIRIGLSRGPWFRRKSNQPLSPGPARFVDVLERLGPTFIKFGQVLSARPDIIPDNWVSELSRLQESVSPLSFEVIKPVIEKQTGPIETVFAEIDSEPLAAASIGQVHTAKLKDGSDVVIKIIRPEIRRRIISDLELMRLFAERLEFYIPELAAFRPTGMVTEFEQSILRELDLRLEANNAERFRRNFADDDRIVVPKIHSELSGERVLVMERIYGVPITQCTKVGNDPKVIAQLGVEVIFKMCYEDCFFHADPHPGNVWCLEDNKIAFLDMGITDFVLPETRDAIVDLLFAIATDQPSDMIRAILSLGTAPVNLDMPRFRRELFRLYELHVRGKKMGELQAGEIIQAAIDIARHHQVVIPTDITLLLKSVATVEGVGKTLHPELDLMEVTQPFVRKLIQNRWGPERISKDVIRTTIEFYELGLSLPARATKLLDQAQAGQLRMHQDIQGLQDSLTRIEQATSGIALSLLILALVATGNAFWQRPLFKVYDVPVLGATLLILAALIGSRLLWTTWKRRRAAD